MNKHPVSKLQEMMAKADKCLPMYTIQNASFATGNKFVCTVEVNGVTAQGFGSNKQSAKLEAATRALEKFENPDAISREESSEAQLSTVLAPASILDGNYIGKLNELTLRSKLPPPTYSDFGVNEKGEFIIRCILLDLCTRGFGSAKKQAKQNAAKEMLTILNVKSVDSLKEKMPCLVDSSNQLLDEQIVEKFKMLSVDNNCKTEQETVDLLTCHSPLATPSASTFEFPAQSTADLWSELENIMPVCTLHEIQRHPKHVLVLNIGDKGEKTLIEVGETYAEALNNLLSKALVLAKTF